MTLNCAPLRARLRQLVSDGTWGGEGAGRARLFYRPYMDTRAAFWTKSKMIHFEKVDFLRPCRVSFSFVFDIQL